MTAGNGRSRSSPVRDNLVPTWKALCRKANVLSTTTLRSIVVPPSTEEFVARSVGIASLAADRRLLDQKILALWQLEGLAFAFFERQDNWRVRVEDLDLPPEAGPPVHCGIAMAAVLKYGFDADRLMDRLEAVADPAFSVFAIETIGLMLAVYERDFFGVATSLLGRVGVVRTPGCSAHQYPPSSSQCLRAVGRRSRTATGVRCISSGSVSWELSGGFNARIASPWPPQRAGSRQRSP